MKNLLLAFALTLAVSLSAFSQVFGPAGDSPWAGPGPTPPADVPIPAPADPPKSRTVCLGSYGCLPVGYATAGLFTVAIVTLPNGYPVAGISGACLPGWDCPGIRDDADRELVARLDDIHRFQRFLGQ